MHWTRKVVTITAAALMLAVPGFRAAAQTSESDSYAERNWWRNAVFYEIYPRSFQDSNNDGIGDLKGITEHLDYLKDLGVDAIWLTPCYPSPQVDFGYDISDYEAIDPKYGTMADFDRLIAEANKRHIRVLMDMVMNHTSDKHKWFLQSRSSKDNPYRDWYMWHDGKGETATDKGQVPNNWQSDFGHSAWEWDEKTRQYYYHKFYIQQPDLNWNNPKVHQAFKDIIDFWLKKGVGGFRFDAITTLFEDPEMRDDDLALDKDGKSFVNAYGDVALQDTRTNNLPGVHAVMSEMRLEADKFSTGKFPGTRVFIGETYLPNVAELLKQYGTEEHPEFELPMDTQIGFINKLDVATFRSQLEDAETELGTQRSAAGIRQPRQPAHRRPLRRRCARHRYRARHLHHPLRQPRRLALLLRRRNRHEDHAAHAQGRREGPGRHHRLAQGERPRRRAHPHAVDIGAERRFHRPQGDAVAACSAQHRDHQC